MKFILGKANEYFSWFQQAPKVCQTTFVSGDFCSAHFDFIPDSGILLRRFHELYSSAFEYLRALAQLFLRCPICMRCFSN